jgi:hypothetical protein
VGDRLEWTGAEVSRIGVHMQNVFCGDWVNVIKFHVAPHLYSLLQVPLCVTVNISTACAVPQSEIGSYN